MTKAVPGATMWPDVSPEDRDPSARPVATSVSLRARRDRVRRRSDAALGRDRRLAGVLRHLRVSPRSPNDWPRLGRAGAEHINDVLNTVFRGLIDERVPSTAVTCSSSAATRWSCCSPARTTSGAAAVAAAAHVPVHGTRGQHRHTRSATVRLRHVVRHGRRVARRTTCSASTRRALVVAGPVSTDDGPARSARRRRARRSSTSDLATALPDVDGSRRRRRERVRSDLTKLGTPHDAGDGRRCERRRPTGVDTTMLLPDPVPIARRCRSSAGRAEAGRDVVHPARRHRRSARRRGSRRVFAVLGEITEIVDRTCGRARRVLARDPGGGQLGALDA